MPYHAREHSAQSDTNAGPWDELVLSFDKTGQGPPEIVMEPVGKDRSIRVTTGIQSAIEQAAARIRKRIIIPDIPPYSVHAMGRGLWLRRPGPLTTDRVIAGLNETGHPDMAVLLQAIAERPGLFGPISFSPGREGLLTATSGRRRTHNLLIVAAPSGAGKTTFMRRVIRPLSVTVTRLLPRQSVLRQAQHTANAAVEYLELPKGRFWQCVTGSKRLPTLSRTDCDYFLLQYELARAGEEPEKLKRFEAVKDLISGAEHVSLITIWTRPELLSAQKARRRSRFRNPRKQLPAPVDHKALLRLYHNFLHAVNGLVDNHLIVEIADTPCILRPQEWLELISYSDG